MTFRIIPRTAGVLLAAVFAASCGDTPAQPIKPTTTAKLEILAGNNQTGGPNEELPIPLTVRAVDSAGNPVAGQIVNFRVVEGHGSVFAGANVTGPDGIARERWTLGDQAQDRQVLEARAVDNATGERIVFGTFTARMVGTTPTRLEFIDYRWPSQALVGQTLVDSIKVIVLDQYNNRVPDAQVTWTVTAGNGRVTNAAGTTASSVVSPTDSMGISFVRFTTGTVAGTNTIRATLGSLQASTSIMGLPASPVRFTIAPPALTLGGVGATGRLTGWGYDRFNNRTTHRGQWRSLEPAIVSVLSPASTQADSVATVRGNAQGMGRVVGQITVGSKVLADSVNVTVQ